MGSPEQRITELEHLMDAHRLAIARLDARNRHLRRLLVAVSLAFGIALMAMVRLDARAKAQSTADATPAPTEPAGEGIVEKPPATTAPAKPERHEVVRATRFEVLGEDGRVLAALGSTKTGGSLQIFHPKGEAVATVGTTSEGGLVYVGSDVGSAAGYMGVTSGREGTLTLFNHMSELLVRLGATPEGDGDVQIFTVDGELLTSLKQQQ